MKLYMKENEKEKNEVKYAFHLNIGIRKALILIIYMHFNGARWQNLIHGMKETTETY